MKQQLIRLFKRLNEEFPPQINEYGREMRHGILFDVESQELILMINTVKNGKIVFQTFELDDGELENIDKLVVDIIYLMVDNDS